MNITDVNKRVKGHQKRHRVGRGAASGSGKTAGRGMKGAGARAGEAALKGFIGGQTPLRQRLPKRGFNNAVFRNYFAPINLGWLDEKFADGETVDVETLTKKGVNLRRGELVKILATGEIKKKLSLKVHACSVAAKEKIEKAGGKIELIEFERKPLIKKPFVKSADKKK